MNDVIQVNQLYYGIGALTLKMTTNMYMKNFSSQE